MRERTRLASARTRSSGASEASGLECREDPPETVNLVVGDLSVAVTNAGEYVFLLEKGTRYTLGLSACQNGFTFDCSDGMEIAAPRRLRGPVNSPAYSVLMTAYADPGDVVLSEPRPEGDGWQGLAAAPNGAPQC